MVGLRSSGRRLQGFDFAEDLLLFLVWGVSAWKEFQWGVNSV